MNKVKGVRAFIELYMRLCDRLRSTASPLGAQLEMLKNSAEGVFVRRDDGDASRTALNALDRIVFFGVVVRIWSALTPEEQEIALLKNTPKQKYSLEAGLHVEQFVIHREVRLHNVRQGDGLMLLAPLRDALGDLTGWYSAEETVVRPWHDDEIAELLRLTPRMVRSRYETAGRKIRDHELFAQLAEND